MLRQMANLRAYEEADQVRERITDTFVLLKAINDLTTEVRQLRAAIEPSSSPIVHGAEAVREFNRLLESNHV